MEKVLGFPISGKNDETFLLEVKSNGSRPLDLKLIGSESSAVFLLKLRHKKINEYKASSGNCADEEWEQILISTFVDLKPVVDLEIKAEVSADNTSVALSFRKNIHGITQRLGSIQLGDADVEISPFDWCVSALASRRQVADELATANAKIVDLKDAVAKLKAQLDDFITSKEEDENLMLEKFRDLLNEKKVKIRQQQRLLAAAKVDPEKVAKLGGHNDGTQSKRSAGSSRPGKRKVQVKEEDEDDEDEDVIAVDKMDVDQEDDDDNATTSGSDQAKETEEEEQQASTEHDTASNSDSEDDAPPPRTTKTRSRPEPSSKSTKGRKQRAPSHGSFDSSDDNAMKPPNPGLPIMKSKKAVSPPKPVADDETPSDDDDEL
ncbi:hypothetical protein F5Y16DRAFT_396128 [Xylariaceae sp. FL0255]|nr:hypothetical protein F5Y16DRAFT_396128 [Xylariaceae sp. FL0255]